MSNSRDARGTWQSLQAWAGVRRDDSQADETGYTRDERQRDQASESNGARSPPLVTPRLVVNNALRTAIVATIADASATQWMLPG